ncbi:MAG TPA: glycoside hydrolase family 38 C-terminal domain-containing protein [Chloroflexota bacterium]
MNPLTLVQRLEHLNVRIADLALWAERVAFDLNDWTFNGRPLARGAAWPSREGVVRFAHPEIAVPDEWPLEHTRLDVDLGGEGLVHLRYRESEEGFGLNPFHQKFPVRERSFSVDAEVVARLPFGVPNPDPRLARARLLLFEPSLVRLLRLLGLTTATAWTLGEHEAVEGLVIAAEHAINALSWPSETSIYIGRLADAPITREIWQPPANPDPHPPGLSEGEIEEVEQAAGRLEQDLRALRERYPKHGVIALTGQAHLDLAWLWPMDETRRKAQRTYHTMVALMERYPEFRFHQSSAQIYAFLEQDDPDLFKQIQEKARAGQWEPIGGMWVEPDANMTSGESMVRQLLYGQRYFRRQFGSYHTVCWMPDCFGFTPGMPQILLGAGITNFFTIKPTWSETNKFPFDLFWWEGIDGSRVLAHMFDNPGNPDDRNLSGYNGDVSPGAIIGTWQRYRGKHLSHESLLSIGYGDGGGGVVPEMLEQARVLDLFPLVPELNFTWVRSFFERTRERIENQTLPVWVGELYLELHRGTLTSQSRVKYLHRHAERDLVAAEALASMCALFGGELPASLESQWQVLLRNEFHDILPGSSIREVNQTTERELSSVIEAAGAQIDRSLESLSRHAVPAGDQPALLLVNPDLSPRPIRAEIPGEFPGAQTVKGGSVLSDSRQVPGLGGATITSAAQSGDLEVTPGLLENAFIRVTLDENSSLLSVYDRRAGREVLAGPGNQLWAYVDKPRSWDAWDIEAGYERNGEPITRAESVRVIEEGPHRAAIRVERRFRSSRIIQEIRLWANSARLEFRTTLDWHDRHWLLKARFPLAIHSTRAAYETAFGVVERPTHRNTSWDAARFEVAGHRFADLSEPGFGVALLNDGKYGYHAWGNELGISLLRAPAFPDPLADEGEQTFTYALLPHSGSWLEGGVLMEAEDLNRPLLARRCSTESESHWQTLQIEGIKLGLGALKPLEDGGGLALRLYEPHGARGSVRVNLPAGWELGPELDLLEEEQGEANTAFGPFQIRTWRLQPGT